MFGLLVIMGDRAVVADRLCVASVDSQVRRRWAWAGRRRGGSGADDHGAEAAAAVRAAAAVEPVAAAGAVVAAGAAEAS